MEKNKFILLGSQIKVLREEKGINQASLAEAIGITRQSMSNYESGKHSPDVDVLERIADYFECSMDYLFGRTPFKSNDAMKNYDRKIEATFNETLNFLSLGKREDLLEVLSFVIESFGQLNGTPYIEDYYDRMTSVLINLSEFAKVIEKINRDTSDNNPVKSYLGDGKYITLNSRSVENVRILEKSLQKLIGTICNKVEGIGNIGSSILDKNFPESSLVLNYAENKSRQVVKDVIGLIDELYPEDTEE